MCVQNQSLSLDDGGTLRDFISRIAQGIYIVTPDGRIVDANPTMLEIVGASSVEQLQEYRSEDLVADPEVRAERGRLIAEQGWLRGYRYQIRCLDGTVKHVRDTVFTQRDDKGAVVALHGVLDVVQDEADPSHTEARLTAFFTGAPAGLAILDRDLRFLRINHRLADMHVLPVEEHIGRTLEEVLPGLTEIVAPVLEQVLDTGTPAVNVEMITEDPTSPDEHRVWRLSAFPVGPADHSPTAVGTVVVDVTDTKRIEQQARFDSRYMAALFECSPLAMITVDPDGRVVAANHAFETMFMMSRQELIGMEVDDFIVSPEDHDRAALLTEQTLRGEELRVDVKRQRRDGTRLYIRIHATPIILDGQFFGALAIYENLGP